MSLTLAIISHNRRGLGANVTKTFGQDGGTIGRALEADWALPDTKRFLSGKHASIDFRSGTYYIVDTSKNGVFVNGADEPVGQGKPQRLFSGDTVRIGDYEMHVTIDNVDDTRESLLSMSHIDPVDRKQRVDAPDPTTCDLIDAHAITGVGIEIEIEEDDDLGLAPGPDLKLELEADTPAPTFRSAPTTGTAPSAPAAPTAAAVPAVPAVPKAPTAAVTSIARHKAAPGVSLDAFFRGAGVDAPKLSPMQAEKLMERLGKLTREFIAGTIDCLQVRAIQKAQLKQSNTAANPDEINPLESAATFDEGFMQLVLMDSKGSRSPAESVHDAFARLAAHERTLLAALRDALDDYLERLDPETIERGVGSRKMGALMGAANKHRYWDLYKDVYAILGNRPVDELPQAFLEELARAYERNLVKAETVVDREPGIVVG